MPDSSSTSSTTELFMENMDFPILNNVLDFLVSLMKKRSPPVEGGSCAAGSSKKRKVEDTNAVAPLSAKQLRKDEAVGEEMHSHAQDHAAPESLDSLINSVQCILRCSLVSVMSIINKVTVLLLRNPADFESCVKLVDEFRCEFQKNSISIAKVHREMFNMYDLLESQYNEVKRALSAERKQYENNVLAVLIKVVKAMKGKETADERVAQAEQNWTEEYETNVLAVLIKVVEAMKGKETADESVVEARRQTASAEAERDKIIGSFKNLKAQKVELIRTCETLMRAVEEVLVAAEKAAVL